MVHGERREAIDVARALALFVVVLGHLALAVVDREGGELRGTNLLRLRPGWAWVAALAPMPVFFAAAGWANATATVAASVPRLRTLAGLGAVVVGGWSAAVVVTTLVSGDAGIVGDGARIATQPLWFLAAYVPFAAAGGRLARIAAAHPVLAIGGCLVVVAGLDAARFALDAPEWVGWPGFFLAWGVPWLAGAWWRSWWQRGDGTGEWWVGLVLLVGAGAAAAVLVGGAGYAAPLIDAVPDQRSNTTPPTLYTGVAALAQVGGLLVVARGLDGLGRRFRSLWDRAGAAAVGVYVWHLTALSLCLAAIAAGLPTPRRLTGLWWATRPLWWAAVLAVTAGFVAVTAAVRSRLRRRAAVGGVPGVLVTALAGATVGLEGPRSIPLALGCTALFVCGWWLLGEPLTRAGARSPGATGPPRRPGPAGRPTAR